MIYSMTGYAVCSKEVLSGSLNIELRAVNSRYLDIQFRMSDEFRSLESAIREVLTAQLNRGKIECRLNFSARSSFEHPQQLNLALFKKLVELNHAVKSSLPEPCRSKDYGKTEKHGLSELPAEHPVHHCLNQEVQRNGSNHSILLPGPDWQSAV